MLHDSAIISEDFVNSISKPPPKRQGLRNPRLPARYAGRGLHPKVEAESYEDNDRGDK
jgi:hypothetical protein